MSIFKVIIRDENGNIIQRQILNSIVEAEQWLIDNNLEKESPLIQIIEVEPIPQQSTQSKINEEALSYLASTDWYIVRQMETGIQCPPDILTARAEARSRVV